MALREQSPPSLTPAQRRTLQEVTRLMLARLSGVVATHAEILAGRRDPNLEAALAGVLPPPLERAYDAIEDEWHQNRLAALASVREDKRNLYHNPAVRFWIRFAQIRAGDPEDPFAPDFFRDLATAVGAGIGRDRRMTRDVGGKPARWVEWCTRRGRRAGMSYGAIANALHLEVDEVYLRAWMKRRQRRDT